MAHYFPLQGPVTFRIHDFVRFLIPLGVEVTVVSRLNFSDIFQVKGGENFGGFGVFRALSLDIRLSEAIVDVFQIISTFLLTFAVALCRNVDFVIISVPPGVPGIGAFFAAKLCRKQVVFDVRDKWEDHSISSSSYGMAKFTNRILKSTFNVLFKRASLVLGVTPSLVDYLRVRGALYAELMPNGVDVNLFRPKQQRKRTELRSKLGLEQEDIVLVFTGGIGGYYKPDVAVRAMYNLIRNGHLSNLKFLLIGSGQAPKMEEIIRLVGCLNLQDRVIFLGRKPREVVAEILPICDLGVVPYDDNPLWTYPQPTKFFEYCASGLPSVAAVVENSDLGMLIKRHGIGYVVEPLNTGEFESALNDFCSKTVTERKKMGERARNMVEESFNRQKLAELLLEHLRGLQNG